MSLKKGYSKGAISENISREMKAGRPQKQAIAIAYATARRARKAAGKSMAPLSKAEGGEIDSQKQEAAHLEEDLDQMRSAARAEELNKYPPSVYTGKATKAPPESYAEGGLINDDADDQEHMSADPMRQLERDRLLPSSKQGMKSAQEDHEQDRPMSKREKAIAAMQRGRKEMENQAPQPLSGSSKQHDSEQEAPMSARERAIAAFERKRLAEGGEADDSNPQPSQDDNKNKTINEQIGKPFAKGGNVNAKLDPHQEQDITAKELVRKVMNPMMGPHDIAEDIMRKRMNDGGMAERDFRDSLDDFLSHDDEEAEYPGNHSSNEMGDDEEEEEESRNNILSRILAKVRAGQ